jgi:hypothetical protein
LRGILALALRRIVEALTNRVRRVCQDLATIEEQLSLTAKQQAGLDPVTDVLAEDMKALKDAIDETRAFLWSYFQSTALPSSERPPELSSGQEAVPPKVELSASRTIDSFFEEIQSLATRIVEKHMSRKDGPSEAD